MKDNKSLLLLLLSFGLVGTWVYHLYDKTQYSRRKNEVFIKDSTAVAQGVQDSLQKLYSLTIRELGVQLDSGKTKEGHLKEELSQKLTEVYRLRTEIAQILKKNDAKKEDIELARRKTIQLQLLVDDLQHRNSSIEEEKQQISTVLDKVNLQVKDLENVNQQLGQENKALAEKVNLASAFLVSELKLVPVTVKNEKEQETSLARKTSKLVISFAVQNNIADYSNAELFVVITQPDGKLLTDDVWESSSTFDAKEGGKKRYTRKIRFEYHKTEIRRELFSLNADEYEKGNYVLQLYHNGYMVGETTKTLN